MLLNGDRLSGCWRRYIQTQEDSWYGLRGRCDIGRNVRVILRRRIRSRDGGGVDWLERYRRGALPTTPLNRIHDFRKLLFASPWGDMLLYVLVALRADDRFAEGLQLIARSVFVSTLELGRAELGGRPVVAQVFALWRTTELRMVEIQWDGEDSRDGYRKGRRWIRDPSVGLARSKSGLPQQQLQS